jgi:hypothetical protein
MDWIQRAYTEAPPAQAFFSHLDFLSGLGDYPQSRTDPFLSLWQLES